jgi:VanZ family protein
MELTWKERVVVWSSVILYCVFIFLLSSQPDLTLPNIGPHSDKFAHLFLYAGLGGLGARAWRREQPGWPFLAVVVFASTLAAAYGASDELHQAYVPGRCSDWRDWLADICGGTFGGIAYISWLQLKATAWRRWFSRTF